MMRAALLLAGLSGASAVIIGAATAHGDTGSLDAQAQAWIDTGLKYQMWHAAALLGVAALAAVRPGRTLAVALACFVAGTLLFSGSLYALAATGLRGFAMATPVGGLAFIAGWLTLAWHGLRIARN